MHRSRYRKHLTNRAGFGLLNRDPLHGMGIHHGGSDIAVSQSLLNRPDLIIHLAHVAGKPVATRLG